MQRGNNRHRSANKPPQRRAVDPMSSSTDTVATVSSSRAGGCGTRGGRGATINPPIQQQRQRQQQQNQNQHTEDLKDFKQRVDSTIQQLSGLVNLLSNKDASVVAQQKQQKQKQQQQQQQPQKSRPGNPSNRGDTPLDMSRLGASVPCCCKCHEDGSQAFVLVPPPPLTASAASSSVRRKAWSSREFSVAATPATSATSTFRRTMTNGDFPEASAVSEATNAVTTVSRHKTAPLSRAPKSPQHQFQHLLQQQPLQLLQPVAPKASSVLRFLWYDSNHSRYAVRDAELICVKNVKRLHISVHYFRVAGEDMLLLEKDCSDNGLAFLDTDSVVAFEGLSVEKLLVLQELGCQLRPEELSREFAVEKGRCKFYVVPVEDDNGKWRLCPRAGHQELESLRRLLEQQETRSSKKKAV